MKQLLNNDLRPKMRLAEIERLIRKHRIIIPPLSRATLLRMVEDGTFETAGQMPQKGGWLIYEDSFLQWVQALDGGAKKDAA
ncbi:MAG TPA: hypothetical protein VGI80_01685 [Pyrinomonadaceae bacterium]